MAHPKQQLIDHILGDDAEARDHSLQQKALERALGERVPRTLTPWEWEAYYAEHGVPDSHQNPSPGTDDEKPAPWWRRLLGQT